MDGWILFMFGIQMISILGHCPVNMNIPAPNVGVLQVGCKHKMAIFLKMDVMMLIKVQ
jgi:hypothetical protein